MPDAIAAVSSTGMVPQPQTPRSALGDLDSDAFLMLLIAQLRNQDPMEPMDHTAMLQQTATFTQVEMLTKLENLHIEQASMLQTRFATELIGQEVSGEDTLGQPVAGVVESVRFTASGPTLVLSGDTEIDLADLNAVSGRPAGDPAADLAAAGYAANLPR